MHIDTTIGIWELLGAGVVGILFLINQYYVLTSLKRWADNHQKLTDEAMKVLKDLIQDLKVFRATTQQELSELRRRINKLEG